MPEDMATWLAPVLNIRQLILSPHLPYTFNVNMRLLCFSDVHGNVDAVKTMLGDVHKRGVDYDAFVFAGDLTNMSGLRKTEKERKKIESLLESGLARTSKKYREYVAERHERFFEKSKKIAREILALVAAEEVPVYYIFGNRDRLSKYDLGKVKGLFNSKYTICLDNLEKAKMSEGLFITAKSDHINQRTILVRHAPGGWRENYCVHSKALLDVTGHTHQPLVYRNFLNTGFLYRDETRGATPMLGGYFNVLIEDKKVKKMSFNRLGHFHKHDFELDGRHGVVYSVHKSCFPFKLEIIP